MEMSIWWEWLVVMEFVPGRLEGGALDGWLKVRDVQSSAIKDLGPTYHNSKVGAHLRLDIRRYMY